VKDITGNQNVAQLLHTFVFLRVKEPRLVRLEIGRNTIFRMLMLAFDTPGGRGAYGKNFEKFPSVRIRSEVAEFITKRRYGDRLPSGGKRWCYALDP